MPDRVDSGAVFALCGLMPGSLTIRDEGNHLPLRFGPLPVLFKTIRYAEITGVEVGRTSILDGWCKDFMENSFGHLTFRRCSDTTYCVAST